MFAVGKEKHPRVELNDHCYRKFNIRRNHLYIKENLLITLKIDCNNWFYQRGSLLPVNVFHYTA